jgi:hypothetical protein
MAKNYVNNKAFLECIVEYRKQLRDAESQGKPKPPMPRYAGECLYLICSRMSTRPNFGGYSYRQDMVMEATLNCVHAFDNFNPDKSNNPFGYFSRIAWRAMLRTIWDERKQSYVKHKNYQRLFVTDEHYEGHEDYTDSHAGAGGTQGSATQTGLGASISDEVVGRFEESLARKKRAAKGVEVFAEDDEPEQPQPNTIFDFLDSDDFSEERAKLGFSRIGRNNT